MTGVSESFLTRDESPAEAGGEEADLGPMVSFVAALRRPAFFLCAPAFRAGTPSARLHSRRSSRPRGRHVERAVARIVGQDGARGSRWRGGVRGHLRGYRQRSRREEVRQGEPVPLPEPVRGRAADRHQRRHLQPGGTFRVESSRSNPLRPPFPPPSPTPPPRCEEPSN